MCMRGSRRTESNWFRENSAVFIQILEYRTSSLSSRGVCMGVFPASLHVFCGLRESIEPHPSGCPLGSCFGSVGFLARCCLAVDSCADIVRTWFTLPAVSQTLSWWELDQSCPLSQILLIASMNTISSQETEGFCFGCLRITSLRLAHDVVWLQQTSSLYWSCLLVYKWGERGAWEWLMQCQQ